MVRLARPSVGDLSGGRQADDGRWARAGAAPAGGSRHRHPGPPGAAPGVIAWVADGRTGPMKPKHARNVSDLGIADKNGDTVVARRGAGRLGCPSMSFIEDEFGDFTRG